MELIKKWFGKRNDYCVECGAPLHLAAIASCRGERNNVSIYFEGLPSLQCQNKAHSKRAPRAGFAQRLIEEIYINDQIPWAESGTVGRLKCLACKTVLEAAHYKRGEIAGEIFIDGLPGFKARLHALVAECVSCGVRQLISDETTLEDVNGAIQGALRDAGINGA